MVITIAWVATIWILVLFCVRLTMKLVGKPDAGNRRGRHWSLPWFAFYGLLLSVSLFGLDLINRGSIYPLDWRPGNNVEVLLYLLGNFLPLPILFVLIAATINVFRGRGLAG
jgi:hypothetical protein